MIGAANKTFLLGLQALCVFSAFLFFIGVCVLADGLSSRGKFIYITFSLIEMALSGATAYFITKPITSERYGLTLAATVFTMLYDLYTAVDAGASTSARGKYGSSSRTIVAGTSLLIIFKTAYLALLFLWKQQLVGGEQQLSDSNVPNGNYQGGQNFQPSTYQNYEPPVSEYQNA